MDQQYVTELCKDAIVQICSGFEVGMGIVPASFGLVVTTYATVKKQTRVRLVNQYTGRRMSRVVYRDPLLQIAFIELPPGFPYRELPAGDVSGLLTGDKVMAAKRPYLQNISFLHGSVNKPVIPFAGQYAIHQKDICPYCTVGGALLNPAGELLGLINTIIPKKKKESITIPLPLLREALEAYIPYCGSEVYRCPACRHVSLSAGKIGQNACPHCGTMMDIPAGEPFTPLKGIPAQIEQALENMHFDVANCRDSGIYDVNAMWMIDDEGTRIHLYWETKEQKVICFAKICNLPDSAENITALYTFLLVENLHMQEFCFSMMQQYIILRHRNFHPPDDVQKWQYFLERITAALRHYRPLLVQTYGCHPLRFQK